MRTFKFIIEYDGTRFNGWQVQPAGRRTIQGVFEKALQSIFQKHIRVYGSGRTDSGVHALAQVAHARIKTDMTPQAICRAINAHLPEDVSLSDVREVAKDFHAQFSAKSKTYRYQIWNNQHPRALGRHQWTHIPHCLRVGKMREAAKFFVGKHDFRSFMATDKYRKDTDTVRKILKLTIKSSRSGEIIIMITANGFLYKMVRNIVGTLIAAGANRISPQEVKKILSAKNRNAALETAPPQGLCLMEVVY